jgi:hypothetical protein
MLRSNSIEKPRWQDSYELKIERQADNVLKFLKGNNANVVTESGYNY